MGRPSSIAIPDDKRVIVRYGNRRLYDYTEHAYFDGWWLMEQPRGSFVVIDHATGKEITKWQLACVRHEEERQRLAAWAKRIGIAR